MDSWVGMDGKLKAYRKTSRRRGSIDHKLKKDICGALKLFKLHKCAGVNGFVLFVP